MAAADKKPTLAQQIRAAWISSIKEPFYVNAPTIAAARRVRFQAYNAVRDVRKNPELFPELARALELSQVSIEETATGFRVRIGLSLSTEAFSEAFAKAGITGEDAPKVADAVDIEAAQSLKRMMEKHADDLVPKSTVHNPYYTR